MIITILKPDEMAQVLGISRVTLKRIVAKDDNFPVISPNKGEHGALQRFVKEKVLDYFDRKKKEDCIPTNSVGKSILLQV